MPKKADEIRRWYISVSFYFTAIYANVIQLMMIRSGDIFIICLYRLFYFLLLFCIVFIYL